MSLSGGLWLFNHNVLTNSLPSVFYEKSRCRCLLYVISSDLKTVAVNSGDLPLNEKIGDLRKYTHV